MAIDTLGANALASDSVTTAKIVNDAVTAAKIPAGAVVADIADGGITTAKLADDAITGAKLANDIAISTTGNIATTSSGTITSAGLITASGNIAIGGTGSVNTLDDYEEGAWVPVFQNSGSTSYVHQLGKYVKVGSMVVATFHIDINSNNQIGSNQLKIDNLPFTVASSSNQYGMIGGLHCNIWSTTSKPDNALAPPNTTRLEFYRSEGVTGTATVSGNDIGTGNLLGHVIFFTD